MSHKNKLVLFGVILLVGNSLAVWIGGMDVLEATKHASLQFGAIPVWEYSFNV